MLYYIIIYYNRELNLVNYYWAHYEKYLVKMKNSIYKIIYSLIIYKLVLLTKLRNFEEIYK